MLWDQAPRLRLCKLVERSLGHPFSRVCLEDEGTGAAAECSGAKAKN